MSILMRRFRLALPLSLVCLFLAGWSGAFRTKDLAVFKLWLPLPQAESSQGGLPQKELMPVAIESVSTTAGEQQRFELRATFSAAGGESAPDILSTRGDARRYGIFAEDAFKHRVELLPSRDEPPLEPPSGARAKLVFETEEVGAPLLKGLEMEGRLYALEVPSGLPDSAPEWSGLAQVAAREFLSVVRAGDSHFVVMLRVPAPESQVVSIKALPLVELSKIGITEPLASIALLSDATTLALLPRAATAAPSPLGFPFWLVRLPGALVVSSLPVYIAAALAVVVSCVLLMFGFKRAPKQG
jgi:hypothetical protein